MYIHVCTVDLYFSHQLHVKMYKFDKKQILDILGNFLFISCLMVYETSYMYYFAED